MTLGLKRGTVRLCPHEPEWEQDAARTMAALRSVLGAAAELQHVGSTAVKTIMAKPIVDIAAAVDDFAEVLQKRDALQAAGFYFRPQDDLPGQLLFACGSLYDGTGDLQTHFIHVVLKNSAEWRDYILFRDYLNERPDAAREYEALKRRLADECPVDAGRAHYLAGKRAFIGYTLRKALVS